jgi:hypothetical protein
MASDAAQSLSERAAARASSCAFNQDVQGGCFLGAARIGTGHGVEAEDLGHGGHGIEGVPGRVIVALGEGGFPARTVS